MNKIKTKTDIVYNKYAKKDIIITHIADIHFSIITKKKKLIKLKDSIIKIKPDYLLITGDLIDNPSITKNKEKIKELLNFLTSISKTCKILISIGNHDVISIEDIKFFDKLNDLYNIYVLNNTSYKDDFIFVSGFTLPGNYYYNIFHDESVELLLEHLDNHEELIKKLPKSIPKIAMIHSPIKVTEKEVLNKLKEYDLILSGHTHNGMVPDILSIFFKKNTGIISPSKRIFPSIAKGKIEKEINNKKITIIINGGITKLSLHSAKKLSKLNFIYNSTINKIIIRKKRGINYE